MTNKEMPQEWHTEEADTCFARSYNGEGSYYCPVCEANKGSVWRNESWRPTKRNAMCEDCESVFTSESLVAQQD